MYMHMHMDMHMCKRPPWTLSWQLELLAEHVWNQLLALHHSICF